MQNPWREGENEWMKRLVRTQSHTSENGHDILNKSKMSRWS